MLSDRYHPTQLLEYQAKELLRGAGVTLLPAQNLHSPAQVRDLRLPYPIALKSQVRARYRARAGGIRFAANAIDAFASARAIFNLAIDGEHPEALLAEVCFQSEREYYLAVVLDERLQRPVLVGAPLGPDGRSIDCYRVAVEEEFSPYYARRLSLRLGLSGKEMLAVGTIVEKMYGLLVAKDLARIEIDPLAISHSGELAILDAKVRVDRRALGRHPDLAAWLSAAPQVLQPPPGKILLAANCESVLLAMGDLLAAATVLPPWETLPIAADADPDAIAARVRSAGIVVASFGSDAAAAALPMAEAIARAAAGLGGGTSVEPMLPPIVFHVAGGPPGAVRQRLAGRPVCWPQDLEAAIAKALAFVLPAAAPQS